MDDPSQESTNNTFSGTAKGSVIQARDIYGDIFILEHVLPTPRQLPPDVNDFVGRVDEFTSMSQVLRAASQSRIIVIDGAPGVGKTALGLRWSHSVSEQFPDGQLFIDLHSFDSTMEKINPREALEQFLRALDVPERKIPVSLEARSALFRSIMANRRALIMIDNVAEAGDVRPFNLGARNCCIVTTSRKTIPELSALNGAESIHLRPFSVRESLLLISDRVGADVVDAYPHEIREVITISGHVPLALRIVGQRLKLAGRPAIVETIEKLTSSARVLDGFRIGSDPAADMRSVITWSYEALTKDTSRIFRMAGLHFGSTISLGALEALSGLPEETCRAAAHDLTEANLIDREGPDRYHQHDLLRSFSRERIEDEEANSTRDSALRELIIWYAFAVDAADRVLEPQRRHVDLGEFTSRGSLPSFNSQTDALSWCDLERKNIVAAASVATEIGLNEISWKLAVSFWSYLDMRKYWDDWIKIHLIGASAARTTKDRYGEAWVLNGLGIAYFELRQYPEAVSAWQGAILLRRQLADHIGAGWAINNLGNLRFETGEMQMAQECWSEAVVLFHEAGNRQGEAVAISNVGRVHARELRVSEAISCQRQAIEILRDIGDRRNIGFTLNNLAEALSLSGEIDLAISSYREALTIRREVQDRRGIARTLHGLGIALLQAGHIDASAESLSESGRLFAELADPAVRDVRKVLAGISRNMQNQESAMDTVSIEIIIAAVSAAAAGVATEAGKGAWASLTSLVKRAFGPHSAEAHALKEALEAPRDRGPIIPLAAGLLARSAEDADISAELAAFIDLAQKMGPEGTGTSNSVSDSAVIHGGLVQGRDFSGPISFSSSEPGDPSAPHQQTDDC